MVFSSGLFLFAFLPLFLAVYYVLPFSARSAWILLASWAFYAWWRADLLVLLAAVSVWTWGLGAIMSRRRGDTRGLLALGVTLNLGALAYFKYFNFFVDSLSSVLSALGGWPLTAWRVLLPIGISFYVFQATSYLIDVHRRQVPGPASFVDLAAYLALFPQLIAGPIIRYKDLAGQLRERSHTWKSFSRGAERFMLGFCKKVLVADSAATIADAAFALAAPTLADSWLGVTAYAVQIYFDFSGYSDMAVGLGLMMGFRFPENFRLPYLSRSVTEFWRRWHISLSTWLRDYLYIPLGGNRKGRARTLLNVMIVMVLGGLWHGAALTFLLWGLWHGLLLTGERIAATRREQPVSGPRAAAAAARTLVLVLIGWVLFRSATPADAWRFLGGMAGVNGVPISGEMGWQLSGLACAVLAAAVAGLFAGPAAARQVRRLAVRLSGSARGLRAALIPAFVLAIMRVTAESTSPFLYFQF